MEKNNICLICRKPSKENKYCSKHLKEKETLIKKIQAKKWYKAQPFPLENYSLQGLKETLNLTIQTTPHKDQRCYP